MKKIFIVTTVSESMPFFKGQINVLKEQFTVKLISSPGKDLIDMANEHSVDFSEILMEREISPVKDFKSLLNLFLVFRKEKPTIVHGNTPKGALLAMIAAWFARVPVRIYYVHGLRYLTTVGTKKKILILMEKISCFFATDIIAVGQGVKNQMLNDSLTGKKIDLIWNGSINGIDTNLFNQALTAEIFIPEISKSDFVFGFVGRLVKDKGIDNLVEAFVKLSTEFDNIKLLLLGSYELGDSVLDSTKKTINSHKSIVYVGRQLDVKPYLKRMDVFVLPSYREGLCGVILEASSMETSIIATDIMGINEIVKNGYNGNLVSVNNSEELFETMKYFLLNKDLLVNYSNNARRFVVDNYSQTTLWNKSLEKYLEILKTKHV